MSEATWLLWCTRASLLGISVAGMTWAVVYTIFTPWWRDHVGQNIVIVNALLVIVSMMAFLGSFISLTPRGELSFGWAYVSVFTGICGVLAWRTVLWMQIRKKSARQAPDGTSKPSVKEEAHD